MQQKFTKIITAAVFASGFLGAAHATTPTAEKITQSFPSLAKIEEVRPIADSGLFEVRVGKGIIFYTNEQATHLVQGNVIEAKSGKNITKIRTDELNKISFKDLKLNDAIKIVKGNGKAQIATFEDPNCGYCKKLTRELHEINDTTVYVFLYPILGQDSIEKSKNIWCAKDAASAYTKWMLDGVTPPTAEKCDLSMLERNKEFGKDHDIRGTPAIIFSNGKVSRGALSAKEISKTMAID